jgi:hypothetical protein
LKSPAKAGLFLFPFDQRNGDPETGRGARPMDRIALLEHPCHGGMV